MLYIIKQWTRNLLGMKKIQKHIIDEVGFVAGDRIIDVGCGQGSLLADIYDKFGDSIEYMGIEPDEKTRLLAERKNKDSSIKFKRAFADNLPSVQDYYTHVTCVLSFHHFPMDKWQECLVEFKRVLAPGGKLIIVEFGKPTSIFGNIISWVNTCRKLAHGIESFLASETINQGLTLIKQYKQFGYITYYVFTK